MLFDNKNYTERQREIITKIGKEKRESIDKDIKKVRVTYLLLFIFLIALGGIVINMDSSYTFAFVFWFLIGGVSYYGIIRKKTKALKDLVSKSDYDVGLYYADIDPRVQGVSDKKLKNIRLAAIILGIMMPFMALLMGLFTFTEEQPSYDDLTMVNGIIVQGQQYEDEDYITIELDDGNEYRISGIYTDYMDIDALFNDVRLGDFVTLLVDIDPDRYFSYAYYMEVEGVQYLDEDTMIEAWQANQRTGYIVFAAFATIGVISIIYYPIYKKMIYNKNKEQEVYNLSFTKAEINELKQQQHEDSFETGKTENKIYIKTNAPKGYIVMFIVLGVLGTLGILAAVIFAGDPSDKIPVAIFAGLFAFLGWFGLFAIKNEYEVLDGDIFYVKRLFKTKEIQVSDIASITVNRQLVIFYDVNTKIITRASTMTKGLAKIVEHLANQGVVLERILQ